MRVRMKAAVGVMTVLLGWAICLTALAGEKPSRVSAEGLTTKTIYHSPQTPGYTTWVASWLMPDGTVMISFHQATGPLEGRPQTRKDVLQKLSWPPQGKPEYVKYDMAGVNFEGIYLASHDGGATWQLVNAEPAATPMNGWLDGTAAIADGTIFRTVWGHYLPFYDVPQTGYWQSSRDGGKSWGKPSAFYDATTRITWPKRLRILRDGRFVVAGGIAPGRKETDTRYSQDAAIMPALWVSEDQGQHWSEPIILWNEKNVHPSEEVDIAELPDGDLLAVIRVDATLSRWQTLLKKDGKAWKVQPVQKLWIPHSGMPELLATREGVVLHLATDGIAWTADQGATWAYLEGKPRTGYYPTSVQLPDGRIFCAYHVGGDNYYGQVDQRIEAITFKLKIEK